MSSSRLIRPPSYSIGQRSEPRELRVVSPTYVPGANRTDREIMPAREWLESRYYSGRMIDMFWREDTIEEWCSIVDSPEVEEVILDGSIGWGKSFFARALVMRWAYELTCLANPGTFFLNNPTAELSFALMSVKKEKARSVLFEKLKALFEETPYFTREAVFNDDWGTKRLLTCMKFKDIGLTIQPVVTNAGAVISDDLFCFVLDEANFLPRVKGSKRALADAEAASRAGAVWSAAREFAKKAKTRIRSRFMKRGKCWGKLVIISSAIDDNDFTEERRKQAEERGELGTKVRFVSRALWEGRPEGDFGTETFRVDIGKRGRPPRIMRDDEDAEGDVIDVPVELLTDFEDDPVLATRELAGRRTAPRNVWLSNASLVEGMWDKARREPCLPEQESGFVEVDRDALVQRTRFGWEPIHFPDKPRAVHIDLSSTGCATGLAVGCSPGTEEVRIRDRDSGTVVTLPIPQVHVDFTVAINAPNGGRIDIIEIEDLILSLVSWGMPIRLVTFDQYQSERSMQTFEDSGIPSRRLSLDRYVDPYQNLRRVLRTGAISVPFSHVLERELSELQEDAATGKVMKHPNGSKDVADAVAGVAFAFAWEQGMKWALAKAGGGDLPPIPM